MKQTAVEWLELNLLGLISFDSEELRAKYKEVIKIAKENEKENQKHIGQITEKGIIDTIGNCANCGVEFHIHKDVTQKQQERSYSEEDMKLSYEAGKKRGNSGYSNTDNFRQPNFEEFIEQFKNK